jgi:hypothetical protein
MGDKNSFGLADIENKLSCDQARDLDPVRLAKLKSDGQGRMLSVQGEKTPRYSFRTTRGLELTTPLRRGDSPSPEAALFRAEQRFPSESGAMGKRRADSRQIGRESGGVPERPDSEQSELAAMCRANQPDRSLKKKAPCE